MNNPNYLDENQKLLIDAYKSQNQQAYDEALQKLQLAGDNLIRIIQKIQSSSQFYMRHMPLMKEERELVSEKDYKEFIFKNQKVLSRNFQKNAYLALLMQQIEDKQTHQSPKKWTNKQQNIMQKMIKQNVPYEQIESKFSRHTSTQIKGKYQALKTSEKNILDKITSKMIDQKSS